MKKPHSNPAYDEDLAKLRTSLSVMADRAEEMLAGTVRALEGRDGMQARALLAVESELDGLEMACDDCALKLLARWQPVASDLRFIATTFKVVTDLERIGDQCVNICERVLEFPDQGRLHASVELRDLARAAQVGVHEAVEALRTEDVQASARLIEHAPRTDLLARQVLRGCLTAMSHDANHLPDVILTHEIAGHLQRIAAHATNIAEMVIFLVRGEDVRHPDNPPVETHVG